MSRPDIFSYLDYRKFLKDYYDYMKKSDPKFSYRVFAKIAKLNSENYLKLVVDGKVHLTSSYRGKFAKGCGLDKKEREYFYKLIELGRCKSLKVKDRLLKKLEKYSKTFLQKDLNLSQYKLLSKWYYMVVRSLVAIKDFKADPHHISRMLRGHISPKEAENALEVLEDLKIIEKVDGEYALSDKHIKARDDIKSTAVRNFHSQMIPMGVEALSKNDTDEREVRAITLGVSKEKALEAKRRIQEFYTELVRELSDEDDAEKPDEVWQLNMQFFKFTRKDD